MSTLTALITSGGGGGQVTAAVPVNGIAQLNVEENLYTDSENRVWLRNGSIITSGFSNYPDAIVNNDLISLAYTTNLNAALSPNKAQGSGFCFSEDGLNFYYLAYPSYVYQYTLVEPYKINSKIGAVKTAAIPNNGNGAIQISLDGTKLYITNGTNLQYYTLSIPYDITTFTFVQNIALGGSSRGFSFSNDGLKLFVAQGTIGIKEFNLVSAWNPVGMTASGNLAAAGLDTYTITWKEDGTKFYIVYASTGTGAEYNCSVPFSFAGTETQVGTKASMIDQSNGKNLFLVPDGTGKTFIAAGGDNNSQIITWVAATAYTISTVAIPSLSFPAYQTATGTAYTTQFYTFSNDGSKAYAHYGSIALGGSYIYEFDCSTPFDLSTATYNSTQYYLGADYNYQFAWTNNGNTLNIKNTSSSGNDLRRQGGAKATTPYSLSGLPSWGGVSSPTAINGGITDGKYVTVWYSTGSPGGYFFAYGSEYAPTYSSTSTSASYAEYYIQGSITFSRDGKYLYNGGNQYLLESPFSKNIVSLATKTAATLTTAYAIIDLNDTYFLFNTTLYKKVNYIGFFSNNVNDFVRIK